MQYALSTGTTEKHTNIAPYCMSALTCHRASSVFIFKSCLCYISAIKSTRVIVLLRTCFKYNIKSIRKQCHNKLQALLQICPLSILNEEPSSGILVYNWLHGQLPEDICQTFEDTSLRDSAHIIAWLLTSILVEHLDNT